MRVMHLRVRRRASGELPGPVLAAVWSAVLAPPMAAPEWRPPCDVAESAEEWHVTAELGGLDADALDRATPGTDALYHDGVLVQEDLEAAPPLLDRMEIVTLSGYTDGEKLQIARRHLVPKQLRANGLRDGEIAIDDGAILRMVREYTREAGVRGLERAISGVARKAVRRIGEGGATPVHVTAESLREMLGRPRFQAEPAERVDRPGIATGLAWTPAGGDVLFVEAAMMRGRPALVLTGMLGDVMRESAQAALTYVRSNAERLGVDATAFDRRAIHVHVPAGAIPKDGPSAGIALMTAIASAARGVPVRPDVAMTGEITLRGTVLPVGGIKEKVLAAFRAGIKTVILPRRNEGDLEDVPEEVRRALDVVLVDSADEALPIALEGGAPAMERPEERGAAAAPVH
jgi:ATP-dependent Lon protease